MALYIRTDIYDTKDDGVSADFSTEVAEWWGGDWEAARDCVRRGANAEYLEQYGRCTIDGKIFTICIWDEANPGEQFADGTHKNFVQYFQ